MPTEQASPGSTPHPSKAATPNPGQDATDDVHDNSSTDDQNNTGSKRPSFFPGNFLWWVGETGRIHEIDDLGHELESHYGDWKARTDTTEMDLSPGYK